ncbi:MAG: nuclear transport factor 2 family protein [Niabella sp.]
MKGKEIVENFYEAFSKLDYADLTRYLSADIIYHDPIFGLLEGDVVFSMWQMKCERLKHFSFHINNFQQIDDEYITCEWQATFLNGRTGKMVTMPAKAFMRILDGKITEHSDGYKLSHWLTVTKGWKGMLFGWTGYMKRREQNFYRTLLNNFANDKNMFKDRGKIMHDHDVSDR